MNPSDTAILHPASYGFRSNVSTLVTRAVAATDAAQRTWLSTHLTAIKVAVAAGSKLPRTDYSQDVLGHGGRHIAWLSEDINHRALTDADIATDCTNICDSALALL